MSKSATNSGTGQMKETKQRCFRKEAVTAEDLAALWPESQPASALLYTPARCVFARLDGGQFHLREGAIGPAEAYEIRIFDKKAELRWRREGAKGTAILWTDCDERNGAAPKGFQQAELLPIWQRETQYLLWGEYEESADGWTRLSTARIGVLDAPHAAEGMKKKDRLALRAIEYFAQMDDGNVVFIGERLAGIKSGRRKHHER